MEQERASPDEYDPFAARKGNHLTTNNETLVNLLRSLIGTGILALPYVFKNLGIIYGLLTVIFAGTVCTHCIYILVKSAHVLYVRKQVPAMSFSEIAMAACETGPPWARQYARTMRWLIQFTLIFIVFGICNVYTVVAAQNFQQIARNYLELYIDIRVSIVTLAVVIFIPLALIRYLKLFAALSFFAMVITAVGLLFIFFFLTRDLPPLAHRNLFGDLQNFPKALSISIFSMQCIAVIMSFENVMKTPRDFLGICGVLNKGMCVTVMVYCSIGILGYWKYGENVQDVITLNLPFGNNASELVKISMTIGLLFTWGIMFYVLIELMWEPTKIYFQHTKIWYNYALRAVVLVVITLTAFAVPSIASFMSLIGAVGLSIIGFLCPVFIETATFWYDGFGKYNWILWKNVAIACIFFLTLIFGTIDSLRGFISLFDD